MSEFINNIMNRGITLGVASLATLGLSACTSAENDVDASSPVARSSVNNEPRCEIRDILDEPLNTENLEELKLGKLSVTYYFVTSDGNLEAGQSEGNLTNNDEKGYVLTAWGLPSQEDRSPMVTLDVPKTGFGIVKIIGCYDITTVDPKTGETATQFWLQPTK